MFKWYIAQLQVYCDVTEKPRTIVDNVQYMKIEGVDEKTCTRYLAEIYYDPRCGFMSKRTCPASCRHGEALLEMTSLFGKGARQVHFKPLAIAPVIFGFLKPASRSEQMVVNRLNYEHLNQLTSVTIHDLLVDFTLIGESGWCILSSLLGPIDYAGLY